jgi:hypothetical protein
MDVVNDKNCNWIIFDLRERCRQAEDERDALALQLDVVVNAYRRQLSEMQKRIDLARG